ncbi:type VII toxin-antitoxin system MntA family adenylyltransferase antitoxin [Halovenus halobia]|uniref:type VII toxin-antitoxin system MntA family adenylyltransferase antitoxin n=1 Tax=Halovenus halobia TaxID=3396622 RepID=UPI003F544EAE
MGLPSHDDQSIRSAVAETLADHPVEVGFLFGSQARGETHEQSDVDVAVAFEDTSSGDLSHVDARLSLGADLALTLGTDEIDVIDLRSASQSLARAVFRDGERLAGTETDARRLRDAVLEQGKSDTRSPAERFDDSLSAIDDHLA